MTSVPNRLLQLSGNSIKLYILFMMLGAMSCSAGRKSTGKDVPPKKDDTELSSKDKLKQEKEIKEKKGTAMPSFENDFNVAIMFPFNLKNEPVPNTPEWDFMVSVTDYYQGVLLALDSLKKEGINLKLHVFDTERDSAKTANLLHKNVFDSLDMIIGLFNKGSFAPVSSFALKKNIPVISPFTFGSLDTAANPYAFYCNPIIPAYSDELAGFLYQKNKKEKINVIYVSDGKYVDDQFYKPFADSLKSLGINVKKVKLVGELNLEKVLVQKDSTPNYVVVASDEQETAAAVFASMRELEGYKITVVGLESWLYFRNQDYKHWEKYGLIMLSNYFVDKDSEAYQNFYNLFRKKYKVVPSDFALRGFDHMMFFGQSLLTFGKYFPNYVLNTRFDATHTGFYWSFNGVGVINKSVNILKFNNYSFTRLPY